jgi:hypothetical membrane protein
MLYHKMTLSGIQVNASFLNWTTYFDNAFSDVGRNIGPMQPIVNYAPVYLKNLTSLIKVMDADQFPFLTNCEN